MNMHIENIEAKLARANEHMDEISAMSANLVKTARDNFSFRGAAIRHQERYHIYVEDLGYPPPIKIGILTGEAVHQMRSALDHLVWAVIYTNTKERPSTRCSFPLCENPKTFRENFYGNLLQGMPVGAIDQIEKFQPYNFVELPESAYYPLKMLSDLDNTSKQRVIPISWYLITFRPIAEQEKLGIAADQVIKFDERVLVTVKEPFLIASWPSDSPEPEGLLQYSLCCSIVTDEFRFNEGVEETLEVLFRYTSNMIDLLKPYIK
ncbi:MAG: hypothetical protein GC168_21195 [Candidatus Hydrogenedens sp.]|nr:hypothetical protein [Candidatus Hydrogenedens sp.]